ncbi:hypothetical protein C427_0685 [Paraglaciecola psychrophila 170]|uniref:Uncharacterized protein n=1 Tax=Paraglaciecola psychrophila 170 TaxID=1129794 RepID=K6ZL42_9ALTE|nr:hypothetical protein C427_0685 [Paraglaciecola psychrophila 170]GAC36686.1 hypothetical protein GPSY_1048 [Paraglaciecola psychrophila 170]
MAAVKVPLLKLPWRGESHINANTKRKYYRYIAFSRALSIANQ